MNMIRKLFIISSALMIFMILSSKVLAEGNTVYWDGEGNDNRWMNPMNWSSNQVPQSDDHVILDGRCTKSIEINEEDRIIIHKLTIEEGYTGTIIANCPNIFRIQDNFIVKGGNILWKQVVGGKRIIFEGDVMIKGGVVEFIGTYKIAKNFIWEGGTLITEKAVFDIYVSNARCIDLGSNQLILKTMNVYHGVSPKELRLKGNIVVCHDFSLSSAVNIHLTEHSILDFSKISKSINMDQFKVDSGSKILIKDEECKITMENLKEYYYSANKNIITLEGNINGSLENDIILKYNLDQGEEKILLEITCDENIKTFRQCIVLPNELAEGKHTINVWAENDRGYCFNVGSLHFYIDNTAPVGTIRTSSEGDAHKEVFIYLTAEDAGSGLSKIILPNGVSEAVSGTVYEVVYRAKENGIYTFKISDHAGNANEIYMVIKNISSIDGKEREEEVIEDNKPEEIETDEKAKDEINEETDDKKTEDLVDTDDEGFKETEEGHKRDRETEEEEVENEGSENKETKEVENEESENKEIEEDETDHKESEDAETVEKEKAEDKKEPVKNRDKKDTEKEEPKDQISDKEIESEKSEQKEPKNSKTGNKTTQEKGTESKSTSKISKASGSKQYKNNGSSPKDSIEDLKARLGILQYLLDLFRKIFTLKIGDFRYDLNE